MTINSHCRSFPIASPFPKHQWVKAWREIVYCWWRTNIKAPVVPSSKSELCNRGSESGRAPKKIIMCHHDAIRKYLEKLTTSEGTKTDDNKSLWYSDLHTLGIFMYFQAAHGHGRAWSEYHGILMQTGWAREPPEIHSSPCGWRANATAFAVYLGRGMAVRYQPLGRYRKGWWLMADVVQATALSFVAAEGRAKLALGRMFLAVCQPGHAALLPGMAYPMVTVLIAMAAMVFGCLWFRLRHPFFPLTVFGQGAMAFLHSQRGTLLDAICLGWYRGKSEPQGTVTLSNSFEICTEIASCLGWWKRPLTTIFFVLLRKPVGILHPQHPLSSIGQRMRISLSNRRFNRLQYVQLFRWFFLKCFLPCPEDRQKKAQNAGTTYELGTGHGTFENLPNPSSFSGGDGKCMTMIENNTCCTDTNSTAQGCGGSFTIGNQKDGLVVVNHG